MDITLATTNNNPGIKLNVSKPADAIKVDAHSGKNGSSAYDIAVKNGFLGTESEWLKSLKGDKGDKGDKGKEIKASVIIGNAESGATADICDFLYTDGDDFAEIFADASAFAKSIGISRVELLSGQYKAKTTVNIEIPEVAASGIAEILPYYGENHTGSIVKLGAEKVLLENIVVGKTATYSVSNNGCHELIMSRTKINGGMYLNQVLLNFDNCKITGELKVINSDNSRLTNCEIGSLDAGIGTKDCVICGSIIGEIISLPAQNVLRNNIIGGNIQKMNILEQLMNVSFGRITTETQSESVSRNIEGNSFEIYVNEKKNMTVNLYTGNSQSPAKTLSSDVFIFFSGNKGDDIVDGDKYQKTLILYMKSTLGVASIGKWIALSDSDVYQNVRIEIICPQNTYRGVIKNKTQTVFCND